jgi:hypothetical protein
MFCPTCGKQSAQGAAFCDNCGGALLPDQQPGFPPQNYYGGQQQYADYPQRSGRRRGLVIGLISAAVVLAASVIVIVILLTGGNSITGLWYSEERAEVIEFKDSNGCYVYTPGGRQKGKYTYDRAKCKGILNIGGEDYAFTAREDDMDIEDMGE